MPKIQDKCIFITGASSGIGASCAQLFAQEGARLILCARQIDKLTALASELTNKYKTNIYLLELDVQNAAAVADSINSLPEQWQQVDILINNAGLAAGADKFQQAELADWEQMLDTNVKGLLYVTRAILPGMLARNSGHIINIGSISGHEVYPGGSVYCATKHAVRALTKGLRLDLLGTSIRVTSVDPGMAKTNFSKVRFKNDETRADSVYAGMTPLMPEDIADAIYYCATRPPHVNISELVILPTDQASANHVHRRAIE